MCTYERSYPKVGVGQILKRYLEYFSSYKHFSKLKSRTQMGLNDNDLTFTKAEGQIEEGCVLLKTPTLTLV